MAPKIPATVVTGFLGSGKTTLIRNILAQADGRRIALIINEFGDLGVDGEILKGCGGAACTEDDVVELSNGCICCTVADDFIPTLEMLIDRPEPPDHIVIETSGLALPQPLVRAFNWPEIRTRVTVDGVVTVVDGKAVREGRFAHDPAAVDRQRTADDALDHETPLSELFSDQLRCADMVVINKTDMLEDADAGDLARDLTARSRAGVQVVQARHGALPIAVLLGRNAEAEDDTDVRRERHHHHEHDADHHHEDHEHHEHHDDHGHDAFESFVIRRKELDDVAAFEARLSEIVRDHDILRLKGFAAVAGKPMRLTVQAVGPRIDSYYDRPFDAGEARETRLVIIGQRGLNQAQIARALAA